MPLKQKRRAVSGIRIAIGNKNARHDRTIGRESTDASPRPLSDLEYQVEPSRAKDLENKRRHVTQDDSSAEWPQVSMQRNQLAQGTRRHDVNVAKVQADGYAGTDVGQVR
jgi:hypothetical protein